MTTMEMKAPCGTTMTTSADSKLEEAAESFAKFAKIVEDADKIRGLMDHIQQECVYATWTGQHYDVESVLVFAVGDTARRVNELLEKIADENAGGADEGA